MWLKVCVCACVCVRDVVQSVGLVLSTNTVGWLISMQTLQMQSCVSRTVFTVCYLCPMKTDSVCLKIQPQTSLTEKRVCDGELNMLFLVSSMLVAIATWTHLFKKIWITKSAGLGNQQLLLSAGLISCFFTVTNTSFGLVLCLTFVLINDSTGWLFTWLCFCSAELSVHWVQLLTKHSIYIESFSNNLFFQFLY